MSETTIGSENESNRRRPEGGALDGLTQEEIGASPSHCGPEESPTVGEMAAADAIRPAAKGRNFGVYLTRDERAELDAEVAAAGTPFNLFVRRAIMERVRRARTRRETLARREEEARKTLERPIGRRGARARTARTNRRGGQEKSGRGS